MFVAGWFFNSSHALSFTMVKTLWRLNLSGIAMGMTNMLIMGIGGMLFQPLIGCWHTRGARFPAPRTERDRRRPDPQR